MIGPLKAALRPKGKPRETEFLQFLKHSFYNYSTLIRAAELGLKCFEYEDV